MLCKCSGEWAAKNGWKLTALDYFITMFNPITATRSGSILLPNRHTIYLYLYIGGKDIKHTVRAANSWWHATECMLISIDAHATFCGTTRTWLYANIAIWLLQALCNAAEYVCAYKHIHMYLYVCVYTLTKRGSVLPSVKLTNWPEPMQLQRHTIVKPPICSTAICVRANKCKLNQHTHTSEFMLAARSGQLLLDLGFYCLTAVWPRIEARMYNCTYVCMYWRKCSWYLYTLRLCVCVCACSHHCLSLLQHWALMLHATDHCDHSIHDFIYNCNGTYICRYVCIQYGRYGCVLSWMSYLCCNDFYK